MPPVQISYHSTASAAPYSLRILASLRAQLPLRNLHWKAPPGTGGSRTSVRSIQELDVDFVAWGQTAEQVEPKEVKHGSLLQCSLVNICFVECDVSWLFYHHDARRHLTLVFTNRIARSTKTRFVPLCKPGASLADPAHLLVSSSSSTRTRALQMITSGIQSLET
jgi:hypothetical protein